MTPLWVFFPFMNLFHDVLVYFYILFMAGKVQNTHYWEEKIEVKKRGDAFWERGRFFSSCARLLSNNQFSWVVFCDQSFWCHFCSVAFVHIFKTWCKKLKDEVLWVWYWMMLKRGQMKGNINQSLVELEIQVDVIYKIHLETKFNWIDG